MIKKKTQSLRKSFKHAGEGILVAIKKERNIKIHLLCMVMVIIAGCLLDINLQEWILCIFLVGFVISMELMNSAIEAVVDLVTEAYHPLAKVAKDMAAGAVLVSSITAAIIGILVFVPKLLLLLR